MYEATLILLISRMYLHYNLHLLFHIRKIIMNLIAFHQDARDNENKNGEGLLRFNETRGHFFTFPLPNNPRPRIQINKASS